MIHVVLDLETTGLDAALEEILEVAAIRLDGGVVQGRFEKLVKPAVPISPGSQAVHGIRAEMVQDAPPFEAVLPELLDFIGQATLVMHNAPFDLGFLNAALARTGRSPLTNPVVDTLEWARELFPEQRSLKLASLCRLLGHEAQTFHRAMDDCAHLAAIFPELLSRHAQKEAWYEAQFPRIGAIAQRYDQLSRLTEELQLELAQTARVLERYFGEHPDAAIPLNDAWALVRTRKDVWEYDREAIGPLLEEWGLKERLFRLDRGRLERWLAGDRLSEAQKERLNALRRLASRTHRLVKVQRAP